MAFLLPGLATAAIATITEGLVSVGVSEGIATTVSAGVVSTASAKITEAITKEVGEGVETVGVAILGKEEYEQKVKEFNELKTKSSFVAGMFLEERFDPVMNSLQGQQAVRSNNPKPRKEPGITSAPKTVREVLKGNDEQIRSDINEKSKMLAGLIVDHSKHIADNQGILGPDKGVKELVKNDTEKLSMVQKLTGFYAEKVQDSTDDYKKIKAIYTGEGIDPSTVVMTETPDEWIFMQYDELGQLKTLKQNKKAFTLPAVYGVFGGPRSPNNRKPINYPDNCFLHHDVIYSSGYFTKQGDLILVARLLNGKSQGKWPVNDISLLNSIVIYFQTVGSSLAYLKGSLTGDIGNDVITSTKKDDIFPILVPDHSPNIETYKEQRQMFYNGLETHLADAHNERGIFAMPHNIIRNKIVNKYEDILVEIK